jgi:riboflavin kinase/FMN adenylyltransferase
MQIVANFEEIPKVQKPCGLTIGNFDGVHRGHQFLLKTLRRRIGNEGTLTVFTFNNHPADVIPSRPKTPPLYPLEYKLKLLEREGVDLVVGLDFTQELAHLSYRDFLIKLREKLPFDLLLLGEGAAFGKKQEGSQERIQVLAAELGFKAEYVKKEQHEEESYSSGRIRAALEQGDLKKVQALLGRPYALYGKVVNNILNAQGLCLPPRGSYRVKIPPDLLAILHINEGIRIESEKNLLECTIEAIFL